MEKKIEISPEEEFWVHCSNIHAWAQNNYDTTLLDSDLAFPLLKKLAGLGDINAERVFKEEIAKRLITKVPHVLKFLLNEGYDLYLNQEELLNVVLNPVEAIAMESLSNYIKNLYYLIFDFDDLRDKYLNRHRGLDDLYDNKYYFSAFKGNVYELEFLLDNDCFSLPRSLCMLKNLTRMHLYINGLENNLFEFNIQLDSLFHLKIFCFGTVKIPNLLRAFPNLKSLEVYGDIQGLTQLEEDDGILKNLNNIECHFSNVMFVKKE